MDSSLMGHAVDVNDAPTADKKLGNHCFMEQGSGRKYHSSTTHQQKYQEKQKQNLLLQVIHRELIKNKFHMEQSYVQLPQSV